MRSLIAPAVLLMAAGCGAYNGPPLHPASGLVTVGGKPAPGVLVRLVARAGGADAPTPNATTGTDGRFSLTTNGQPGSPEGTYSVTLTWPPPAALGPPGTTRADRLGGRYSGADRPFTEATRRPGANDLGPFELPAGVQTGIPKLTPKGGRR